MNFTSIYKLFYNNHRNEIYTLAEYISFQQEKQTKLGEQ